jgi:tetratricopeptide (TPR) repeat protein
MTVDECFNLAFAHHQAGRLSEAEPLYRAILAKLPDHAASLHMLGVLASQMGQNEVALELIGRSIALAPDIALPHANLAEVLAKLQRWNEVAAAATRALTLSPHLTGTLVTLGLARERLGDPNAALACYREALRLVPDYAQAHINLGALLFNLGQNAEAEPHLREAVRLQPSSSECHANLAGLYLRWGRFDDAEASATQALAINAGDTRALVTLGYVNFTRGHRQAAETLLRRAVALAPDYADARYNLAVVIEHLDQIDEAKEQYETVLRQRPDYRRAARALAVLAKQQGDLAEAERRLRAILATDPGDGSARLHLAFLLLLTGRFEEGWVEYEARWASEEAESQRRALPHPQWRGEDIGDEILLLHAEQGLGDTLQFCRYVPEIARRHRVMLEVPEQLFRLFQGFGGAEIILAGTVPPPFRRHSPLLSLPYIAGTRLETIPADIPYLAANEELAAQWRPRLAALPGLKVGLVWAGGTKMQRDYERSIPLARFTSLAGLDGVSFVSLQKGDAAAATPPLGLDLIDWTAELIDFADTAALVAGLDLVIAVDTAIIHLAGAMGKPVWLLNRFIPDWRWLLDRDDSPWYPTLRQFRQTTPGDWDAVLARVRVALEELAMTKTP